MPLPFRPSHRADAIAVLGTGSSVGKSLVAAGLCRALARRGVRVAPFKAQNMSNNAAVTAEGGEIGRAQAVQAAACGLEPHVDMNPILLKPESDARSQVVVSGVAVASQEARAYFHSVEQRFAIVRDAYDRLAARHDVVVIEGAGSCAELNLRTRDIVNMRVAEHADARVLLVGDIERGGVFAQLIGTLELLEPAARARVAGLLVNKFRGDRSLFDDGVALLEERTGVPVLGVIPRLMDLSIDEEDGAELFDQRGAPRARDALEIAVLLLPRLSNWSDVRALAAEPDVALRVARAPAELRGADAIIIPGTKSTLADLAYLNDTGMAAGLRDAAARGCEIVGICGGMQILGRRVADPHGVEGGGELDGVGLLDVRTVMAPRKITARRTAVARLIPGAVVNGYEIHCGRSESGDRPAFIMEGGADGAISPSGRVWGTYLHGVFDGAAFRRGWLNRLRERKGLAPIHVAESLRIDERLGRELDRWATHLQEHLCAGALERLLPSRRW